MGKKMSDRACVIVGAGHAAAQLAISLRREGWEDRIILLGEEPYLPYNRPPLSKEFLAGNKQTGALLIRSSAAYEKLHIECLTGTRCEAILPAEKRLRLSGGKTLGYDKLALVTGARVRTLDIPGKSLPGVCYLRNIGDVEHIQQYIVPGSKAVIVGAGYIGLEAAAVLNKLGMHVTVLETADRVLGRVTDPEVSAFFTRVHKEEGVEIRPGMEVAGFEGDDEQVRRVVCRDGETFPAELVIVGIGIIPNMELAAEAGLEVDDGILVDAGCMTADANIVAAGDCARFFHSMYGERIRLESVQNAVEQANVAAAAVCGKAKEYNALPWFWSDQYDVKLQIAGLSRHYDRVVIRGDSRRGRKFAAFYFKGASVIAVDAVNSPQEFMLGKRIITGNMAVDPARLADAAIPMKAVMNR